MLVQNVVLLSSENDNSYYEVRKQLETVTKPEIFVKTLKAVRDNQKMIVETKSFYIDIILFTLLKKFPETFTNIITKIRKEFTLETACNPKYAALCTIKKVKIYPENLLIVKYINNQEDEHIDELIGAKRFIDMPHMALYDFVKNESYLTDAYRVNYKNTLMWFAPEFTPENDSNDDSVGDNFEKEDYDAYDIENRELGVNLFLVMQLYDGAIKAARDDRTNVEDVIGNVVCTFQEGKLRFAQGENIIRTFNVLPQQDGRYVRRTKSDKIKYFFVENDTDPQDTELLLLKKSLLIIKALPVLQMGYETENCRVIDFFRKYGINDVRQGESKNSLYIQSTHDKKYHEFTVAREKIQEQGILFKNYTINSYCGIYQGIVSQDPKEYPFSNWLKLRFFKSDDSMLPGMLELWYGEESVPLPIDDVIDISCAKCIGAPGDLTSGTNIVFKTIENEWYQFSTNGIIDSLTNGDV